MTTEAEDAVGVAPGFIKMFHPSLYVPNLDDAENWFQRVFGRSSIPLSANFVDRPPRVGYPTDYSIFTPIAEVLFDTVDPSRYLIDGEPHAPSVREPELRNLGWYMKDPVAAYRILKRDGVQITDQLNDEAVGEDPPGSAGTGRPMFFLTPDNAGIRYQFVSDVLFQVDHRVPGWTVPEVSDEDPLGIVMCSHHTVLTDRPNRALHILVNLLGAEVIYQGDNEAIGTFSTYVYAGDCIIEYASPRGDSWARAVLKADSPRDSYHGITFKVVDLERVSDHLRAQGVGVHIRTTETIVTDPATSLGVAWGFTTSLTPGDPRAR